jgi:hypothetical protein
LGAVTFCLYEDTGARAVRVQVKLTLYAELYDEVPGSFQGVPHLNRKQPSWVEKER